jgi:hypothetical protein
MKFATKLALVFSTIFFTVGLIVSLSVYSLNRATLEEAIKNDLQDIAFHTLDKIDRMLSERCGDIEILATDPVMISKSSTPKQITERLIAFRDIKKRYVSSHSSISTGCVWLIHQESISSDSTPSQDTGRIWYKGKILPRISPALNCSTR